LRSKRGEGRGKPRKKSKREKEDLESDGGKRGADKTTKGPAILDGGKRIASLFACKRKNQPKGGKKKED